MSSYLCPQCAATSSASAQHVLNEQDYQRLQRVLRNLDSNDAAWPFRYPVDSRDVPDYYQIIKNPCGEHCAPSLLRCILSFRPLNGFRSHSSTRLCTSVRLCLRHVTDLRQRLCLQQTRLDRLSVLAEATETLSTRAATRATGD